jgi:hypothetical protein
MTTLYLEANPCCLLIYVKCFQTFFRSGQRGTDFEQNQILTTLIGDVFCLVPVWCQDLR